MFLCTHFLASRANMRYLFILITCALSAAKDLCIRGFIHERETLPADELKPWSHMTLDSENGIVYYIAWRFATDKPGSTLYIRSVTLTNPPQQGEDILQIFGISGITVDRSNGNLYIAHQANHTNDINLRKYNRISKDVTFLAEKIGDTRRLMPQFYAFKNRVYFIDKNSQMSRYSEGKVGLHNIKLVAYAEDPDDAIYFIKPNDTHTVYKVKRGEKTQLKFTTTDVVTDLITDARGKVFAGSSVSYKLYEISEEEGRLLQASDQLPRSPHDVHFDKENNLFFVDPQNFYTPWGGVIGPGLLGKYARTIKLCEYTN